MTERVICRPMRIEGRDGHPAQDISIEIGGASKAAYEPAPGAPSIEEIVRVMRQAQVEVFPTSSTASKLGSLIARLDGGET